MNKLYQTAIKAHSSSPIGRDRTIETTHFSEGYNASCGDEIDFSLALNPSNNKIDNLSFKNDSCVICTASASILCDLSITFDKDQVHELYLDLLLILGCKNDPFNELPTNNPLKEPEHPLMILAPVAAHPSRINCALLPWQTALAAFDKPLIRGKVSEAGVSQLPATVVNNA